MFRPIVRGEGNGEDRVWREADGSLLVDGLREVTTLSWDAYQRVTGFGKGR